MFKVRFVVHSKGKKNDQAVKIVGNLPALGSWNPHNGLALDQYYEGQWESIGHIEIPNGHQFEFKIVKISNNKTVEWQELPNNSNRKFKPKFHTKLILTWSKDVGQALNEAKSSMKLQGLPGVMVKGNKQTGMLKRKPFKNKKSVLSDSDSENENENDSFCSVINRKKSTDIRESISNGDIEQIYYDTTELENVYHSYKKIQVFLVCRSLGENKQFMERVEEQLKELNELENFQFKWLILDESGSPTKARKACQKKIQFWNQGKFMLEDYNQKNVHKNHFIFLDLQTALKTEVGNTSACLFLPGSEFESTRPRLQQLEQFQLICFDSGQANRELFRLFEKEEKKVGKSEQDETTKAEKFFNKMTIQKILEELQYCSQSQTSIKTVHSFTRNEALTNILTPNSVLIIDSELMKVDKRFFELLISTQCEKRLIIIIHRGGMAEWMRAYDDCKSICVVLQNFSKLYFVGKTYDPSKKHRNAIQFLRMRAKLCEEEIGGSWSITDNSLSYKIKDGTQTKFDYIKSQIENILLKDFNYFKINMKENKLKINWNLSHPVRLLRTLLRIKFIEEGQIGDFYLVSCSQNFSELKEQVQLLVNVNHLWMVKGKQTSVYDFGYGEKSAAKFSIKTDGINSVGSSTSTSSSKSGSVEKGAKQDYADSKDDNGIKVN